MKKILGSLFIVFAVLAVSCRKNSHTTTAAESSASTDIVTQSNKSVSNFKKVLLEEYTGHLCPNCPTGSSIIANTLMPQYSSSLVVISVHEGSSFAAPNSKYTDDYRTDAGESWGAKYPGYEIQFWPCGLVNRKNFNSTEIKLVSSAWAAAIPTALQDPFIVKLDVTTTYDNISRALNVSIDGTFKSSYPNATKWVALFVQDHVKGWQTEGSNENPNYQFENMLRGDLNGSWGADFKTGATLANENIKVSVSNFTLPNAVKGIPVVDSNISVVVYVYDASTREVLQVEKVKIK